MPQVWPGLVSVMCPRWGRDAPGGGGARRCEAPGMPQGGGPWGYRLTHISAAGGLMLTTIRRLRRLVADYSLVDVRVDEQNVKTSGARR